MFWCFLALQSGAPMLILFLNMGPPAVKGGLLKRLFSLLFETCLTHSTNSFTDSNVLISLWY